MVLTALAVSPRPAAAQAADEVTYYHADAIGSVRMITGPNQEVLARYDYLPFGEPWPSGEEPPPLPNTRRFAGKELDAETGFEYFGARYVLSNTGRFTTVDPIQGRLQHPEQYDQKSVLTSGIVRAGQEFSDFLDPSSNSRSGAICDLVGRDGAHRSLDQPPDVQP